MCHNIKGTIGGVKTLLWSTVLISFPIYAVALILRQTLGENRAEHGAENFRTLPQAIFTIFRCIVGTECVDQDGRPIFELVARYHGWFYSLIYCCFQIFMTFGLFNVIVGIFVENVLLGAKTNDQVLKRHRLADQRFFARKMTSLLFVILETYRDFSCEEFEIDYTECDPMTLMQRASALLITPPFLEVLRITPQFVEIMGDLGITEEDTLDLFDTLDVDATGTVDVEELCDGLGKMRGDARRKDTVTINLLIQRMHLNLEESFQALFEKVAVNEAILMKIRRMLTTGPERAVVVDGKEVIDKIHVSFERAQV